MYLRKPFKALNHKTGIKLPNHAVLFMWEHYCWKSNPIFGNTILIVHLGSQVVRKHAVCLFNWYVQLFIIRKTTSLGNFGLKNIAAPIVVVFENHSTFKSCKLKPSQNIYTLVRKQVQENFQNHLIQNHNRAADWLYIEFSPKIDGLQKTSQIHSNIAIGSKGRCWQNTNHIHKCKGFVPLPCSYALCADMVG